MALPKTNRAFLKEVIGQNIVGQNGCRQIDFEKIFASEDALRSLGIIGAFELIVNGWRPQAMGSLVGAFSAPIVNHHNRCGEALQNFLIDDNALPDEAKSKTIVLAEPAITNANETIAAISGIRWRVARVLGIIILVDTHSEETTKVRSAGYPVVSLFTMGEIIGK